jgi:AbrB family looped-hinge helix DNA binding protein
MSSGPLRDYTYSCKDGSSQDSRMATRITIKGHVTVPRRVREALRLAPGDAVEFHVNGTGEVVLRKASPPSTPGEHGTPRVNVGADAQMQRRAEELLALLRGLD